MVADCSVQRCGCWLPLHKGVVAGCSAKVWLLVAIYKGVVADCSAKVRLLIALKKVVCIATFTDCIYLCNIINNLLQWSHTHEIHLIR